MNLEVDSRRAAVVVAKQTAKAFRAVVLEAKRTVAGILERLGTSAEYWEQRLKQLLGKSRLLGSYSATSRERLRKIATHRGVHHVDNTIGLTG